MPQTLKCPSCAAPLHYDGRSPSIQCEYCNNVVLMPQESRQSPPTQPASFGANDPFANFAPQININRLVEINDLAHSGRKIEAIKLFRETFNVSLKDAKEAVERLERGEAINISGQQRIMAFHDTDVQNQWYGTLDRGEMVINAGVPGPVAGRPFANTQSSERPKAGCLGPFLAQFGCLLFLFFWIPFLIVMVGTLIYPDMVVWTAPLVCDEGYQDAYAERVGYYRTNNFEGNNIVLLHCVYGDGIDEIPHPLQPDAVIFAVPMAVLTILAFGIAFLGRVRAMAST